MKKETLLTLRLQSLLKPYYLALMSKSLVERGREYAIQDNGVYMNPPNVSSHMMDVAANVISNWFRKVELIRG